MTAAAKIHSAKLVTFAQRPEAAEVRQRIRSLAEAVDVVRGILHRAAQNASHDTDARQVMLSCADLLGEAR